MARVPDSCVVLPTPMHFTFPAFGRECEHIVRPDSGSIRNPV